jgi:hypothetical protein
MARHHRNGRIAALPMRRSSRAKLELPKERIERTREAFLNAGDRDG